MSCSLNAAQTGHQMRLGQGLGVVGARPLGQVGATEGDDEPAAHGADVVEYRGGSGQVTELAMDDIIPPSPEQSDARIQQAQSERDPTPATGVAEPGHPDVP
jgi:hypothetical protein